MKRYILFLFLILTLSCKITKNNKINSFNDTLTTNSSLSNDIKNDSLESMFYENVAMAVVAEKAYMKETNNIIDVPENKNISTKTTNLQGRIIYIIPDTMLLGKNYEIKIRISKSKNILSIINNINNKTIKTTIIPITEKMQINIVNIDSCFKIYKNNSNIQLIDINDTTYTEQTYNIIPIKHGKKKISIVVSIITDKGLKEIVYSDDIFIQNNFKLQVKTNVSKYQQQLFSTILIPLIVFFYKKYKSKDDNKN